MPKKKGVKDKSHLMMYWRKGWRYPTSFRIYPMTGIILPRFDKKEGCFMDDS